MKIPEKLYDLLSAGRLPHACALVGSDRPSLTSLSHTLATALVCTGKEKPCGTCGGCVRSAAGSHPDIIQPDSSTLKSKSISVDAIRSLRQDAYVKPSEALHKVFLLTEPLTPQAQNSLLKVLEEPPMSVYFILVCDAPDMLLKTVQSRVTFFFIDTKKDDDPSTTPNIMDENALSFLKLALVTAEVDLLLFTASLKTDRETIGLFFDAMMILLHQGLRLKNGFPMVAKAEYFNRLDSASLLSLMELTTDTKSRIANAHIGLLLAYYCSQFRRICGY